MIQLRDARVVVPASRQGDPDRVLLAGVTLDLAERRVAVIGANGSGKSTLLRLLNGLRTVTSGQVLVDGLDADRDGKAVRQKVGFIFTDPLAQLLMSTPVEDVELSLRSLISNRAERTAQAHALLEERGIGHVAHQSIYDLSGGERQLVALTSVLAVEPAILVADEPTTLLDLRNKLMLRRVFAELDQQIVFSTHDLDVALDAERVIVVDGGRIVADGEPGETVDFYTRIMADRVGA
ncbi:energy-coupling factor ABC transporter ATP-binding protein [Tessaracoccus sp. ZS01]|uniref:energy-coupling factor ABC transporter ATP-binding protein n=1 Tax=Tessaracoccus sp. ZS01 TaxID=1906324 RepID=UPI00096FA4BE|nr:ABC transporter ATP-binding protein [Tessaracoccus sp. ZS01]MCG6566207.1 ABC transporter ATP-binding protein [Tessaracoccus sp. ZS01]OMG58691.1 cobalt ABC transporter ATP-binding protein [Tessaracoccus sp. ZS01]